MEDIEKMALFTGYIGCYTNNGSKGIYAFTLDTDSMKLGDLKLAAALGSPTYLTVSGEKRTLYAVAKKEKEGGVASFTIGADGQLTKTAEKISDGASPCYLALNQTNDKLVTGNYHRGTVTMYRLDNNGTLAAKVCQVRHQGRGAALERQEGPHVHYADYTPDGRYLVAIDLGTDRLITYTEFEGQLKQLQELVFPDGTGPRHLIFHPTKPVAYVQSELSSEIFVLSYEARDGRFAILQTLRSLPGAFLGHNQGGAIKISPEGRYVYVSNRGHDSIGIYRVNSVDGRLALVSHASAGGSWPRDFELDPSGRLLVVANQESGNLVLFQRDTETGKLSASKSELLLPSPTCVKFL